MKRRTFLHGLGAVAAAASFDGAVLVGQGTGKIDRLALVRRHLVVMDKPDALAPLSVGNGELGFTADVTGLQTFPEFHAPGMPLHTMAQWAWHESPNPHGYTLADTIEQYDSHGTRVPYPSVDDSPAGRWLHANPHKFDLARIGFVLPKVAGRDAMLGDLMDIHQVLDIWNGLLVSEFMLNGQKVSVETVVHPEQDVLAVRVRSALFKKGMGVAIAFPGSAPDWRNQTDWDHPETHTTTTTLHGESAEFVRQLDGTTLTYVSAAWNPGVRCEKVSEHRFAWSTQGDALEMRVAFASKAIEHALPTFDAIKLAASSHWNTFWMTGGAVDLASSKDPRWKELERRIVLSQYQTAVNCAGSLPPQETGLVTNSWGGKFHLEMYWWHEAHFALWGREALLKKSLGYYQQILPVARETAARIGCRGARWPKMIGPAARESPNGINGFLVWQQPHPIHFAELMYQAEPNDKTLQWLREVVFESAEFMASFAWWNAERKCYELGPPITSAQEEGFRSRRDAKNPTFELAYWCWSLGIAQEWRKRLGMEISPEWEKVRLNLAPLATRDGVYVEIEQPVTPLIDHPTMLGAFGVTPATPMVNRDTMQKTLDFVFAKWNQKTTWGWDYPMMAMTAARLGRPDQAIEALFIETPKNRYLANGHNFQQLPELPLYLPGNGGLLFAIALMAAGWKDSSGHAPGFPSEEHGWVVRHEGLRKAL